MSSSSKLSTNPEVEDTQWESNSIEMVRDFLGWVKQSYHLVPVTKLQKSAHDWM